MTQRQNQNNFSSLKTEHANQVARLHIKGISTGFISSLGIDFVTALYEGIAQSKSSFGIVAQENESLLGFVAFTTNLNKLYKSVILKKGLRFAIMLAGKMSSTQRIKKVLETLFYPGRIRKMALPRAELLSIVVAEKARGKGLANDLVKKGLGTCRKKGIAKVKVLVGMSNGPANKLYQNCGFELVCQLDNHGVISNVYVAKTDSVCLKAGV